jgi:hypothetical protein
MGTRGKLGILSLVLLLVSAQHVSIAQDEAQAQDAMPIALLRDDHREVGAWPC